MAKGARFDMLLALKTKGEAGLKRMGNSMQGLQGRLKNVRTAALSVNTAFKAMAIILTAGAFSRVITGAINQADAFGKLSRQTGIAADTLQSYVNAGKLAGVEQTAIDKGLSRLAQSIREADQGVGTYLDTFKALGISVRDTEGNLKSTEQVFGEVADRFADMENGGTKAALSMELFSRQGRKLIPLLNEGSEAMNKWNYETSEGFAANAEYFNDQLTMIGFGFDGFRKQLSDALLPALNSILEAFRSLFESKGDWEGLFKVIGFGVRSISFLLLGMVAAIEEIINYVGVLKDRVGSLFGKDKGKNLDKINEEYSKGLNERFQRNKGAFNKIIGGESEAGDEYGFNKGTKQAALLETQLKKTFGAQMKAQLKSFRESIKTVGESMANVVVKGIKGMEDALVNFVMTGKLSFKSLANSIITDMARIAIQQAITKPLVGWFTGLFSAKGNVFDGGKHLTAYAKGGVIDSPHYKYMANGGIAVAGEKSAEAILPLRRRNGVLGVEGGGNNTNISVSVDASGSQVEGDEPNARELGNLIAAAIQSELIKQKRNGGLLAPA
jgi:hypothetical protein